MRLLLTLVISLLLATAPAALAQNWGQYDNSRFAYGVSIPPEFAGEGEAANSDGQVFTLESRVARLAVWGGYFVTEPDFEAEARSRLETDLADGWGLTAQSTTSSWAEWSATKSGRVMHQRLVQLCDGQGYAALRLEYAQADRRRLDPLVSPLVASLKAYC
jgi:hypothetical protein